MNNINIKLDIGLKRVSTRNDDPIYQEELLRDYGASKFVLVKESAYDECRPLFDNVINNLPYHKSIGVIDISRITRRGYDDLVSICERLWIRSIRIFIVAGETISDYEITKDNIHLFRHEAESAINNNYLRSFHTMNGIKTAKRKSQNRINASLKNEKVEQIIQSYKLGLSNRKTASRLNVSINTVCKYVNQYKEKCGGLSE